MGLDIIAYSNIKKIRKIAEGEEYDDYSEKGETFGAGSWPERMIPLEEDTLYTYDKKQHFCIGGYIRYNRWRDTLAFFQNTTAEEIWEKDLQIPFRELINFSDCEGTIAGKTAVKLYKDFVKYEEEYKYWLTNSENFSSEISYYMKKYKEWKEAFKIASNDGAIAFG